MLISLIIVNSFINGWIRVIMPIGYVFDIIGRLLYYKERRRVVQGEEMYNR